MNRIISNAVVFLVAVALLAPGVCRGVVINTFDSSRQDRFYEGIDKNFIGDIVPVSNWSCVGKAAFPTGTGAFPNDAYGRSSQWVTMISPSYFLSAQHSHVAGGPLVFYEGNELSSPRHVYMMSTFSYQVPGTDVWMGKLTTPVDSHIYISPILVLPSASNYVGRDIYSCCLPLNRVVRNKIFSIDVSQNLLTFTYTDYPDGGYYTTGDSGGPSFAIVNNALALVGLHWHPTGDSFPPFVVSQLQANMVGETLTVICDPAVTGLADVLAAMDSKAGDANWNQYADFDGDKEITATDLAIKLSSMP